MQLKRSVNTEFNTVEKMMTVFYLEIHKFWGRESWLGNGLDTNNTFFSFIFQLNQTFYCFSTVQNLWKWKKSFEKCLEWHIGIPNTFFIHFPINRLWLIEWMANCCSRCYKMMNYPSSLLFFQSFFLLLSSLISKKN